MNDIKSETPYYFTLDDNNERPVSLKDYRGEKNVVLVFNRSFM